MEHFKAGRYAKAEHVCKVILNHDSKHLDSINLLGVIAMQTGKYERAVEMFRHLLHINSNLSSAYQNLGVALDKAGHQEEAVRILREAIKRNPGNQKIQDYLNNILNNTVLCWFSANVKIGHSA